jgi:ribonucleoside-diphosphate reductase alpha chain
MTFQLLVRYCIRQRLTPLSDPVSHAVGLKNMRVGVALGGLCDFDWSNDQLAHWYGVCRSEANKYARELRVNEPITVTTVKPSGTISLLNGSSPGIHAPHSPFYIRRTRIAKNDPIIEAFIEANVPFETDQYDNTGHTLVFSFPTKAQNTRSSAQTETIRDQFERQRAVQENWADNAVSATLSFNAKTEREELAACLKEHVPHLKSTSLLSKTNSYVQAPYEAIDEATYNALAAPIRHDHPLVRGGNFEVDECASGVCPVR